MKNPKLLIALIFAVVGVVFIVASISHYQRAEEVNIWLKNTGNQASPIADERVAEASQARDIFYQTLSLGLASEMFAVLLIMGTRMKPEAKT